MSVKSVQGPFISTQQESGLREGRQRAQGSFISTRKGSGLQEGGQCLPGSFISTKQEPSTYESLQCAQGSSICTGKHWISLSGISERKPDKTARCPSTGRKEPSTNTPMSNNKGSEVGLNKRDNN
eukprot:1161968-Pelagomonas_calceolata.AAC.10